MKKKSLAIYLPSLASGGAERLHIGLAPTFLATGWDVTFVLQHATGAFLPMVPKEARVVALNRGRTLSSLPPLVRFLKQERPDILLSNLGHNNIIAIWATLLARTNTRAIVSQHSALSAECNHARNWQYRVLPWFYKMFLPFAHGIICVSQGVATDLTQTAGIKPESISIIHNPVIFHDFADKLNTPVDHPWLADKRAPVVLAVGRLQAQKDFTTLISAFALLAKKRDIRLIVLGEGDQHAELSKHAQNLGVGDRVDLPGFITNPLPYMRAANVLVMSSLYEGFGNVLVEALACGTPVVSTDCQHGPVEVLEHGRYGQIVAVGDPEGMAAAIEETIDHPPPEQVLIERAQDFTADRAIAQYLQLFGTAMKK
jgi:glycosyltransferase involved in cell wall biosynthesis